MSTIESGRRGEDRAVSELVRRGYAIVERNYRCRLGELDVVARDGEVLVFVEVRTRASGEWGTALATVNRAKQRQVAKVAEHYLAVREPEFDECRFDVVGITEGRITVVKDAFRPGLP